MTPTLPLNQGQQLAADGFFKFLMGKDKELIVSGPAGVGKTFLMGHLIDKVLPMYENTCSMMNIPCEYDEVMMTATTNKAADVLSSATGKPTQTIHSFMNLKVVDDYSTGKSSISKTKDWRVHDKKIIFVDEGFTVDTPLRNFIMEGTIHSKIIYVGDHCQLPPVMEAVSPITKINAPFFELTEPMRNAGQPALMALCMQLRNTVETGIFGGIKIVPGVIDHYDDTQMEYALQHEFPNLQNSRILAYTNNRVTQYNDYLRQVRQLPPAYTLGERLINNSAIQLGKRMLTVEEEIVIVDMGAKTRMVPLAPGIDMEVFDVTIQDKYNAYHDNIKIPVDRDHYLNLIKYFAKQKNWDRYFHLKNQYPDLRPVDSSTIHKSQGSTYDTVFIDLGNLSTCRNPALAARLLYVAASRAKTRVVFYGDLAEIYGRIIK